MLAESLTEYLRQTFLWFIIDTVKNRLEGKRGIIDVYLLHEARRVEDIKESGGVWVRSCKVNDFEQLFKDDSEGVYIQVFRGGTAVGARFEGINFRVIVSFTFSANTVAFHTGATKVDDVNGEGCWGNEDICWFDIIMKDSNRVEIGEGVEDIFDDGNVLGDGEGVFTKSGNEGCEGGCWWAFFREFFSDDTDGLF